MQVYVRLQKRTENLWFGSKWMAIKPGQFLASLISDDDHEGNLILDHFFQSGIMSSAAKIRLKVFLKNDGFHGLQPDISNSNVNNYFVKIC